MYEPWEMIKEMAVRPHDYEFGIVTAGRSQSMGGLRNLPWDPRYSTSVQIGMDVQVEVIIPFDGYLVFINKGTSGDYFLLSPSKLVIPEVRKGKAIFPNSFRRWFHISEPAGLEQMMAIVFKNRPSLSWMSNQEILNMVMPLSPSHLGELLSYCTQMPEDERAIFYSDFQVVDPLSEILNQYPELSRPRIDQ